MEPDLPDDTRTLRYSTVSVSYITLEDQEYPAPSHQGHGWKKLLQGVTPDLLSPSAVRFPLLGHIKSRRTLLHLSVLFLASSVQRLFQMPK